MKFKAHFFTQSDWYCNNMCPKSKQSGGGLTLRLVQVQVQLGKDECSIAVLYLETHCPTTDQLISGRSHRTVHHRDEFNKCKNFPKSDIFH